MNTLYISDLDGTLLGGNVELSEESIETINSLIAKGMNFSIATARTAATVCTILDRLSINTPVILMNGVAIFDLEKKEYVSYKKMNQSGKAALFNMIKNYTKSGFVYSIENHKLSTYYENTNTPGADKFIEERQRKYNKVFTKVSSFDEIEQKDIVYYSIDDEKEKLTKAYNLIKECPDLHVEFYRDIYIPSHWYLEISAAGVSKKEALTELRRRFSFDRVISFGDNLNDLSLFEASEAAYAVENAKDEVKNKATAVIESNENSGVARFLKANYND